MSYSERDCADVASAAHAIAHILRQQAVRSAVLDEEACEQCDRPLNLMVCPQCGVEAFLRTWDHGKSARAIRIVDGAAFFRACRA